MSIRAFTKIKVKVDVKPAVEGFVFRLHYRYTYLFFMIATLLSSLYGLVGECGTLLSYPLLWLYGFE